MLSKIWSRKFILSLLVTTLVFVAPMLYKALEVSDMVTMTALGLFGAVGAAYGFMNVKAKVSGEVESNEQPK